MVNNNRLVETCIRILRLLLDKKLHYNEIIRQTSLDRSPDRTHVDSAIDALEREQVIMEFKISKRERKQQGIHSQAKMMQLTDLGRELIDMLVSLEKYKKAYFDLDKQVKVYFDKSGEKKYDFRRVDRNGDQLDIVRKSVLRESGFTDEDLKFYNDSDDGTSWILSKFEIDILEIIIARCALRLYRFNIIGIAKEILNNIVVNAVTFRMSVLLENIRSYSASDSRVTTKDLSIYEDFAKDLYSIPAQFYYPTLIQRQVKNAIMSYLSLSKPPEEAIVEMCEWIRERLEEHNRLSPEQKKKLPYKTLNFPKRVTCLFDSYQEYRSKLG